MSTTLEVIEKCGSRGTPLTVTRYWGGKNVGTCFQLTQEQEEKDWGYVQLTEEELKQVLEIIDKKRDMPND